MAFRERERETDGELERSRDIESEEGEVWVYKLSDNPGQLSRLLPV